MTEASSKPSDAGKPSSGGGAIPAWKLRESMRNSSGSAKSGGLDPKEALKKKMQNATLDPNLPPAFKVAMKDRLAFAKQQARRNNNDTFVSLNSSHPAAKEAEPDFDDFDDSFASMGEDILEEEE